jgi:hypothetical protein
VKGKGDEETNRAISTAFWATEREGKGNRMEYGYGYGLALAMAFTWGIIFQSLSTVLGREDGSMFVLYE